MSFNTSEEVFLKNIEKTGTLENDIIINVLIRRFENFIFYIQTFFANYQDFCNFLVKNDCRNLLYKKDSSKKSFFSTKITSRRYNHGKIILWRYNETNNCKKKKFANDKFHFAYENYLNKLSDVNTSKDQKKSEILSEESSALNKTTCIELKMNFKAFLDQQKSRRKETHKKKNLNIYFPFDFNEMYTKFLNHNQTKILKKFK
ncbi:hypothetical protein CWI36_0761p0010 [Hamiltosporidium magnivora]|uniref:Uncharacterized protein n=1 Tax=Hamiltosporidium magnivora TaxID=148818 RepID=A0A4Q9L9Q7_9MICR|nr:hypothetical protein CWI36_0761p0010 [Hamiltosporidium magnivora]